MLLGNPPEIGGRGALALIAGIEVPHRVGEAILIHSLEIEHHDPKHVEHPGALLIDDDVVTRRVPGGRSSVAQPDRRALLPVGEDLVLPAVQHAEVLVVVLPDSLEIPETGKIGEPFAQPLVVVAAEVHPYAPPLMGNLVGPEDLVLTLLISLLKGPPREMNQPGERLAMGVRNFGRVHPGGSSRTISVLEKPEALGDIRPHSLLHVLLP